MLFLIVSDGDAYPPRTALVCTPDAFQNQRIGPGSALQSGHFQAPAGLSGGNLFKFLQHQLLVLPGCGYVEPGAVLAVGRAGYGRAAEFARLFR